MTDIVISVENLSKQYRLGLIGGRTLRDDLARVWARLRGQPDPLLKIGHENHSNHNGKTIWALQDVSFQVKQGEVVGIIGRNAAGKSTLLKILSRITAPTAGQVKVKGRVASLLEVGTGFHPELTGRENIYLNGAILGMRRTEINRKFDEIVDFSGVEKFIDTPVKRYSSGMYVRLAFAVAAHLEPEILVVDEVLAVGDTEFQKKCLWKMGHVAKEGRTVLFVSHNMTAVQHLCESGLLLRDGRVVLHGSASEAVERYLSSISSQDYGFADLSQHLNRPQDMLPVIQSLAVRSSSLVGYRGTVKTGEDVTFEIQYDCGDMSLDYVVIGICSLLGERVCTVGTHLSSPTFDITISGKGSLECCLPCLGLAEGEYSVLVAMGTRMPMRNIDYVEDSLHFRVESGDYFGTGRTLLQGQGYLAQQSRWRAFSYPDSLYASQQVNTSKCAEMQQHEYP